MTRLKVAVLRGGPSNAYDESLKTGGYILSLLNASDTYEPLDVFISKSGDWHRAGLVDDPAKILDKADIVWNALHGEYGESGEVQQLLETLQIPYTGSGISGSAFAHHKDLAKEIYRAHGIPTPISAVLREGNLSDDALIKIFRTYLHPVVVKPATGVRGIGIRLAHSFQELKDAVKNCFSHSPKVLVEEYISGTAVSTGVIEKGKGEDLYALLPTHLETEYRRVRPRPEENRRIEEYAKRAHEALGLRHYSASDFVITPRGKIYILETNSSPLIHEDSLFNRSLEASGWKAKDFVDHSIRLVLK